MIIKYSPRLILSHCVSSTRRLLSSFCLLLIQSKMYRNAINERWNTERYVDVNKNITQNQWSDSKLYEIKKQNHRQILLISETLFSTYLRYLNIPINISNTCVKIWAVSVSRRVYRYPYRPSVYDFLCYYLGEFLILFPRLRLWFFLILIPSLGF